MTYIPVLKKRPLDSTFNTFKALEFLVFLKMNFFLHSVIWQRFGGCEEGGRSKLWKWGTAEDHSQCNYPEGAGTFEKTRQHLQEKSLLKADLQQATKEIEWRDETINSLRDELSEAETQLKKKDGKTFCIEQHVEGKKKKKKWRGRNKTCGRKLTSLNSF